MAKMIELELAHWVDPDIVERVFTGEKRLRRGHVYYDIWIQHRTSQPFRLRHYYTLIQADKIIRRIRAAQSKPKKPSE